MSEKVTRRKLLRVGAGTAALGAVGSLSGCSAVQDLIPGGGGGLGSFSNWVYAPDTFESDQESFNVSATNYKSISSNGNVDEDTKESITTRNYPKLGISGPDVAMELNLPEGSVIAGSFDTQSVKDELTADRLNTPTDSLANGPVGSTEYESDSTYNDDYELFVQSEPDTSPDAYAVGNGTVIRGQRVSNSSSESDPVDATDVVEGIIDTGTGGPDRLIDSEDDFKTLVDKLNTGVSVSAEMLSDPVGSDDGVDESISQGLFDGLVGSGSAESLNGNTAKVQIVYLFDSEGDVNESDIQDWIEANDTGEEGALNDLEDISVSTDGKTATVTGTIKTFAWSLNTY